MRLHKQTIIPVNGMPSCKKCGHELQFRRTCLRAYFHCPQCSQQFELKDYASELPDAMEEAASMIPMDRI